MSRTKATIAGLPIAAGSVPWPRRARGRDERYDRRRHEHSADGPVAPSCSPINDGAQAWFKQINANGGIHGRKIENIVLDDVYKAPEALANAREPVSKGILAFFGGCGSIQPAAILPLAQQNSIPYLFPFAGNPELMNAKVAFPLLPPMGSSSRA
jgi:hypothetical protein